MASLLLFIILIFPGCLLFFKKNASGMGISYLNEFLVIIYILLSCLDIKYNIITISDTMIGAFGTSIAIKPHLILILVLLLINSKKVKIRDNKTPIKFLLVISILSIVSFYNPANQVPQSTFILTWELTMAILPIYFFINYMDYKDIFTGIYKSITLIIIFQTILTILFPILDISQVTQLFYVDGADIRYGREGAVGTFIHPNIFANFMSYCFAFVFVCYTQGYAKRKSLILTILAFVCVYFSYSRSAIIAVSIAIILNTIISKTQKNSKTKYLYITLFLITSILLFAIIVPYLDSLTKGMDDMYILRYAHWIGGLEIIKDHWLIGVGINQHIPILNSYGGLRDSFEVLGDFIENNPIHNSHIIIMAEMGVVFSLWMYYHLFKPFFSLSKLTENKTEKIFFITQLLTIFIFCFHSMSDWAPIAFPEVTLFLFCFFIGQSILSENNKSFTNLKPLK